MAALSFASPTRVLDRMKRMEDVELPSLPSIQPNLDYDSGIETSEGYTEQDEVDEATPHTARQATYNPDISPSSSANTSASSARLPRATSEDLAYVPDRARTSTPYYMSDRTRRMVSDDHATPATARYLGQSRSSSDTGRFGGDRSDQFHTPGEMSVSFSDGSGGDGLDMPSLPNALGEEMSIPLNGEDESMDSLPAETPLRRFSNNVVVNRPGRRSQSLLARSGGADRAKEIDVPSPVTASPVSVPKAQDRVPSLTKSETTDTSHAATTPEQPARHAPIATPSFSRSIHQDHSLEVVEQPTSHSAELHDTPATVCSTPGLAREPAQAPVEVSSAYKPFGSPVEGLSDMTDRFQRSLNTPFTPSPTGMLKNADFSTPRAPLNDSERRKSHVLEVLQRSAVKRRTPHPLRRSMSPDDSTHGTPLSRTPMPLERSSSAPNDSIVSITSSADLTTDRRAVATRFSRGNTSFPTMLLGNANTSGQSSVRPSSDRRADGIKIQKHLNAMNKQLLETNADLAREAEGWKEESQRLRSLLKSAGVPVDDVDVAGNIAANRSTSFDSSRVEQDSAARVVASMSPEQHAAVMADMAERIEELESSLNDKDAQIVEMQDQLAEAEELRRLVQQGDEERDKLHAEFAAQTADNARQFAEISEALEKQVEDLQIKAAEEGNDGGVAEVKAVREELDARARELEELEEKYAESADLITELEARSHTLEDVQQKLAAATETIDELEKRLQAVADANTDELEAQLKQTETALEAQSTEADQLRDEVDELNRVLEERDAEIQGLEGRLETAELAAQPLRQSISANASAEQASFVAAIEERLDEAYREIGRLKHELASSPARKATMEAKDARIKALEREKASLLSRSKIGTPTQMPTPSPLGRPTPMINKSLAHLRAPLTPGSMKELSWLNTTVGDANESILRAQVEYLQEELDKVNGQLDSNFSRLEEAGLGSVALAEKLAAALAKIGELEDEIRALLQKDKSAMVHVRQAKSVKSDNAKERTRLRSDIETLKKTLAELTETSDKEIEKMRLATIDALDAAHEDVEKAKKDAIAATQETARVRKDLDAARAKARGVESDLSQARTEYDELHRRHVKHAADSVPRWEVQQKDGLVKRLEGDLRDARARVNEVESRLRREEQALSKAKEEVRNLTDERARVSRQIEAFDADLAVQTGEAAKLKEQLRGLRDNERAIQIVRADLERLEREKAAAREEFRGVERELRRVKAELEGAEKWRSGHACGANTAQALEDQRARFKIQTRELGAQIKYLMAKCARESTFKNALCLQKRYLLLLVGGMSLNEQATLKAMAQIGYPVPEAKKPNRTFRAVGMAVLATIAAKNAAMRWKDEVEAKSRASASFNERRRA